MDATSLYREGRLREAIDAQVQEVKARPADQGKRLFLFELLCYSGELDRARRQIEALRYDDPPLQMASQGYRLLLDSEEARRRVFAEGVAPDFLGEPPDHLKLRLEAAGLLRLGKASEAASLVALANEALAATRGTLNGKPFEFLRDADDLFAGVLEVMAQGRYFWVALEQVVSLTAPAPRFPRDLIYLPARLELDRETGEVFLPTLYPGTHEHDEDPVRLGRATDWKTASDGLVLGVGARTLLVDEDAVSLLEWREMVRHEEPNQALPLSPEAREQTPETHL